MCKIKAAPTMYEISNVWMKARAENKGAQQEGLARSVKEAKEYAFICSPLRKIFWYRANVKLVEFQVISIQIKLGGA